MNATTGYVMWMNEHPSTAMMIYTAIGILAYIVRKFFPGFAWIMGLVSFVGFMWINSYFNYALHHLDGTCTSGNCSFYKIHFAQWVNLDRSQFHSFSLLSEFIVFFCLVAYCFDPKALLGLNLFNGLLFMRSPIILFLTKIIAGAGNLAWGGFMVYVAVTGTAFIIAFLPFFIGYFLYFFF